MGDWGCIYLDHPKEDDGASILALRREPLKVFHGLLKRGLEDPRADLYGTVGLRGEIEVPELVGFIHHHHHDLVAVSDGTMVVRGWYAPFTASDGEARSAYVQRVIHKGGTRGGTTVVQRVVQAVWYTGGTAGGTRVAQGGTRVVQG